MDRDGTDVPSLSAPTSIDNQLRRGSQKGSTKNPPAGRGSSVPRTARLGNLFGRHQRAHFHDLVPQLGGALEFELLRRLLHLLLQIFDDTT